MSYRLRFSKRAEAYLSRLDRATQERFGRELRALVEDPYRRGTKPLHGLPGRALRVGGWRVIYSIDDTDRIVAIELIGPRGQVYRQR